MVLWDCFKKLTAIFLFLTQAVQLCPNSTARDELVIDINDAEAIAVANNVILHTIKGKRETFKMISNEKFRNYLPRLGISYFGLKNTNINQPDSQYNDIRIQLNQLVYDGGENMLEIEGAKLQELLNHQDWQITRDKLLLEIRKAYIKLISNKFKYAIVTKALERIERSRETLKLESKSGFINDAQKFEYEAKLREIELLALRSYSSVRMADIELKKLMNVSLETQVLCKDSVLEDFVLFEPSRLQALEDNIEQKNEVKKNKIAIQNLRLRQEILESYWKPKIVFGGYYGQNVNGQLPVRNEVFGFNIGIQAQLGSTTNQSNLSSGVQTDGTGIQRIPGFGPQFVGRGENAFNSSTFNLFDDLSYSRKIYEGKISLDEAVRSQQQLEINLKADIFKSMEKLNENWQVIRINNAKFLQSVESWKNAKLKVNKGFISINDQVGLELDLVRSIDELSVSVAGYIESSYELSFFIGKDPGELLLVSKVKGNGNSIFKQYSDEIFNYEAKNSQ